jgi:hypothetical protein
MLIKILVLSIGLILPFYQTNELLIKYKNIKSFQESFEVIIEFPNMTKKNELFIKEKIKELNPNEAYYCEDLKLFLLKFSSIEIKDSSEIEKMLISANLKLKFYFKTGTTLDQIKTNYQTTKLFTE